MFATPAQQLIAKFKIEGRMEELEAMSKRKAEAEGTNLFIQSSRHSSTSTVGIRKACIKNLFIHSLFMMTTHHICSSKGRVVLQSYTAPPF